MTPLPLCTEWIDVMVEREDGTTERICLPVNRRYLGGVVITFGRIHEREIPNEIARMQDSISRLSDHRQEQEVPS